MIPRWAHFLVEFVGWWFLLAVTVGAVWVALGWHREHGA